MGLVPHFGHFPFCVESEIGLDFCKSGCRYAAKVPESFEDAFPEDGVSVEDRLAMYNLIHLGCYESGGSES